MNRKQKNSYFNVLIVQNGMRDYKADFLSNYGATSTLDLSDAQIDEAIARLQTLETRRTKAKDAPLSIRRLRSAVILAAEDYLGFKIGSKPAWESFNRLMLSNKIAGKMLWELDENELKTVLGKLKKIARQARKKKDELNRAAQLN